MYYTVTAFAVCCMHTTNGFEAFFFVTKLVMAALDLWWLAYDMQVVWCEYEDLFGDIHLVGGTCPTSLLVPPLYLLISLLGGACPSTVGGLVLQWSSYFSHLSAGGHSVLQKRKTSVHAHFRKYSCHS